MGGCPLPRRALHHSACRPSPLCALSPSPSSLARELSLYLAAMELADAALLFRVSPAEGSPAAHTERSDLPAHLLVAGGPGRRGRPETASTGRVHVLRYYWTFRTDPPIRMD
eukprot:scaffold307088_cov30-Tisochrysis_lutea.AAC.1